MAFPSAPANGQTYVVNGIVYSYSSADQSWTRTTTVPNVLTISNTAASTSTTTGALVVTGGIGVGGNITAGGNVTAANATVSGTLVVNGVTFADPAGAAIAMSIVFGG